MGLGVIGPPGGLRECRPHVHPPVNFSHGKRNLNSWMELREVQGLEQSWPVNDLFNSGEMAKPSLKTNAMHA